MYIVIFVYSFCPRELTITKINISYVYRIDVLRFRRENYSRTPRARPSLSNI